MGYWYRRERLRYRGGEMATEKKLKDPAEAALSAIEQALNLGGDANGDPARSNEGKSAREGQSRDAQSRNGQTSSASSRGAERPELRLPEIEENELRRNFTTISMDNELTSITEEKPARKVVSPDRSRVANDDRQSIGMMMQALRAKPSRRPYIYAALASFVWIAGIVALAAYENGVQALLTQWTSAQIAIATALIFAPATFFFTAAMLSVRSQEMKFVAGSIGEVAIRLAEPESFSTDAVLTISQAVRREVAAVGDGIERALARAGELETLVRSEISTLERAYSDNEIRIRSLVDELITQRESIVANADRVRNAIAGSHQNFSQDLELASQRLIESIGATGERVSLSIEDRGERITTALGRAGERVIEDIASRGNELVERLAGSTEEVKSGIALAGEELTGAIELKSREFRSALDETGASLSRSIIDSAGSVTPAAVAPTSS